MRPTSYTSQRFCWDWALGLLFVLLNSAICCSQDSSDEDSPGAKSTNVLGRLFGSPPKSTTERAKPKPKIPATTAAGRPSRAGLLVPLKSFSKAFRGPTESEILEETEVFTGPPTTQARTPREPFRNLPRVQERRERETSDLQVKRIGPESDEPLLSVDPKTLTTKPAPIIRGETTPSKNALTKPSTNSVSANSRAGVPLGTTTAKPTLKSPEIFIESNSTSRRTAMDILETETPKGSGAISRFSVTGSPSTDRSKSATAASNVYKPLSAPKNLIELGLPPAEKTPAATSSANRQSSLAVEKKTADLTALSDSKKEIDSFTSEGPKTTRSTTVNSLQPKPDGKTNALVQAKSDKSDSVSPTFLQREMSLPAVRVSVKGPNAIRIDEDGAYEIVAKNEGTENLNGLIVRIAVPTHVKIGTVSLTDGVSHPENDEQGNSILWELEQLPAGTTKSARLVLTTAKPEHFALGVEWTVQAQTAEMQIAVNQPQLAVALEGPSEVSYGEPQTYKVRVRNTGNADAKSVLVALSAEPYGSNQSNIGDIASGSERIVEVELTFQQAGTLPIVATASSSISKLEAKSKIDVQVRQSELVSSWFGPAEHYQGSVVEYELELTNSGSIAALGTQCKIKLPPGVEIISLPAYATHSGESVKWEVKRLDPNEKLSFTLKLSLSQIGENHLSFTGECPSGGETNAEFTTSIDSLADLHLAVIDPVAPAPVGQPVVYEIIVTNRGKKAASDVQVLAQFSDGIEPTRLEGHAGRIVPGQAIFNSIPSIGPNEKLSLRILAEASKSGVHRFRAEVKSQGSDTDLLEEESTRYLATGLKSDRR